MTPGEGAVDAAGEATATPSFVDTTPNPQAAEGGDAGERQGGRRRNRRGGRGRDRDDTGSGERSAGTAEHGSGNGEANDPGVPVSDASAAPRDEREPTRFDPEHDVNGAAAGSDAAIEPRGEGSRRRGRGGRGRDREGRDGNAMVAADSVASESSPTDLATATPLVDIAAAERGAESVDFFAQREELQSARAAEPTPARVNAAPIADVIPRPAARDEWRIADAPPRPAPAPAEPVAGAAPVAAATSYALPLDSLAAVAEAAGLQWVNSDATKIEAAQSALAADPPPAHVPREIRPVAVSEEGPLVLVETKKDLSQVKLPVETASQETQGRY